jgi:signal transduction histidine kinase
MKRGKLYAISYLLASVILVGGIGIWNFIQANRHVRQNHDRWVERVTARIMAERLSTSHSLQGFPGMSREEIRHELFSRPDFVGAYWFDVRTHEFERWVIPSFERILGAPDPRVVVSQLRATEAHSAQLGPVLILQGSLFTTSAVPLDRRHALVVVEEAPEIKKILEEESAWAHLHAFVYDLERHPIFVGGNLTSLESGLSDVLAWAQTGVRSGTVPLSGGGRWQWVATFHAVPGLEWVFILTEPTVGVYYPVLLYLGSLLCLIWLSSMPWKAAEALRRAREGGELRQFAARVENFVKGKDVILNEPPYPHNELMPIVSSLRWLMPQWKRAEAYPKELGLERKLLSLLIESLPEGILFFNSQGALQLGNELGKVFMSLQQEKGREFKMVGGIQVPRGFLEPYAEPVFAGLQANMGKEVEVSWADGKHLYRVWVEAVQVDDQVEGFIVVVRDITFRKQWEYVQEQVLSGITHDLRGPLSAIMGYLDLLRRQLKEGPPKALEYAALAREAGNRLTQMISDILDVVRFEQGKIEMDVQAVPVEDLFERVRNIFGVTAGQKNVALKLVMGHQGILATGDRKLLERVLDNLVGNAIKFTPSGGIITVTALHERKRTVFSVADTGRGIPKEAQSRIFDKFQQVRPGDRSGGYGLGLAVVKFIVEAHKGEIRLESEVDKGSTFTFFIPDQALSAKADASLEASGGESARS